MQISILQVPTYVEIEKAPPPDAAVALTPGTEYLVLLVGVMPTLQGFKTQYLIRDDEGSSVWIPSSATVIVRYLEPVQETLVGSEEEIDRDRVPIDLGEEKDR